MLSVGIWDHHYRDTHLCRSGLDFGVSGVDLSQCDVVISLLRPQQASDWNAHPYDWILCNVFWYLDMLCMGIYRTTLTVIRLCRSRVDFGDLGIDLSLSQCCVVMSWLRPQQALDLIPHPYWMYTEHRGTLVF